MSRDGSVETWPKPIGAPGELADDFASAIGKTFDEFPYCVRTPPDHAFHGNYPEQFLCLADSRMAIYRRKKGVVDARVCGLDSIDSLESETTLLASRLKVYPDDGKPFAVPYNAVGERHFKPFITAYKSARGSRVKESEMLRSISPDPFRQLAKQDFRYHNYVFDALPDDAPRAHFYHPATKVPNLLQRSRIISAYLLVASPSMLYCLSEEPPLRSSRKAEYSIMFRYMPFSAGVGLDVTERGGEDRFKTLSIRAGKTIFAVPLSIEELATFDAFRRASACEGG